MHGNPWVQTYEGRKIIMFGFFKKDEELEHYKNLFKGMVLVEELKTKINRHEIFWIGRSKYEKKEIRIGIRFSGKREYFYSFDAFKKDTRLGSYQIMTYEEADELEETIKNKKKA